MDDQPQRADKGEQQKADRNEPTEQLFQEQDDEFLRDPAVELAVPGQSVAEGVGNLLHLQRPGGGSHQIHQDLEADVRQPGQCVDQNLAPDSERSEEHMSELQSLMRTPY